MKIRKIWCPNFLQTLLGPFKQKKGGGGKGTSAKPNDLQKRKLSPLKLMSMNSKKKQF